MCILDVLLGWLWLTLTHVLCCYDTFVGNFRPERIEKIADRYGLDADQTLENIVIARAYSHDQQMELLRPLAVSEDTALPLCICIAMCLLRCARALRLLIISIDPDLYLVLLHGGVLSSCFCSKAMIAGE